MESICVINYESLRGAQNEEIVKEISVAGKNVLETFHFKSPYIMKAHSSEEKGIAWADGQLEYDKLRQTIREAVSGYAHLYAYGIAKTRFLTELVAQPVRNLEDFNCPQPQGLKSQFSCSMPCHKNYVLHRCATRNAQTLFKWLVHHLTSLNYIAITPRLIRVCNDDVIFLFCSSCIKRR